MPFRQRAREWSSLAFALGLLFASLPLAARLFSGAWAFEEAGGIAAALLAAAVYFYIVSVRMARLLDPAAMLDQAAQFLAAGRTDRALRVLAKAIRQSPRVWQSYQYRGQLYLQLGDPARALVDFEAALRLAPDEPMLHELHDRALRLTLS